MSNRPFFTLLLALFSTLALAFCGGGGGSSTTTELTSMSQLKGTYKLTSAETKTARSYDLSSLEIYTAVAPPYYSNYGKGGTCFSFATIVSETKTGDGLQVILKTEETSGGLPSCGQYIIDTAGITARAAGILPDVSTFQEADATGDFGLTGDGFFVDWPLTIPGGPPTDGSLEYVYEPFSSDVPDFTGQMTPWSPDSWFQVVDQTDGDSGSGDITDSGTCSASQTPVSTCIGIGHQQFPSIFTYCVKYTSQQEIFPGMVLNAAIWSNGVFLRNAKSTATVDANGEACFEFEITFYGDYTVYVAPIDELGSCPAVTQENFTVTSAEQDCPGF